LESQPQGFLPAAGRRCLPHGSDYGDRAESPLDPSSLVRYGCALAEFRLSADLGGWWGRGIHGGGRMKRFVLVGVVLAALLAFASSAAASSTTCNTTLTGATVSGDLVVPEDGACTIVNSTVGDDVKVGKNAYFQSTGSTIGGDVKGSR